VFHLIVHPCDGPFGAVVPYHVMIMWPSDSLMCVVQVRCQIAEIGFGILDRDGDDLKFSELKHMLPET
jgi:hypothetical protein